ncbi:autophagy-related protein 9A isoform X1 [Euwallacea similis]|uniref:autophagy-related protein 9A isoform X1 n=1 Tax=Euwallacea similis TaxID=1736056 RepID=UPI003450B91D
MTTNYASLNETPDFYGEYGTGEYGIPNQHMSEPTRSQWNHIEDLDSFFTRVYKYHQKHGFKCIALKELVDLHQFSFIAGIMFTMIYAVDYNMLFNHTPNETKWIFSLLIPFDKVMSTLPFSGWMLLFFLGIMFFLSVIRKVYALILYWDIKQFYNQALLIEDDNLDNLTWHEVQKKLIQVQLDLQMCIHKRELTELDIYHRILRQTNYLVALVNKRLLPPRVNVPFLGEVVYWTKNLRLNIMILLFWSPWSPFENPWHLREEYKRPGYRDKMAQQLGRQILWLFLINLLASPLVFVGQIIFYFFNYFEQVRREPGRFGLRYWSHYGQLYFRHFNELDHELHSRLTRAYKPATKYMASFCSPHVVILAQHVTFICSSVLTVFICLSFLDNEILYWEQVLTMLAILTGVIGIGRSLVPDETLIWCPEQLLEAVVLHTHYLPGVWQGYAHTSRVRACFQQLFQYRFAALIEEFLSPILVPYFLIRYVYPRTLDFVDFFRNFTVSVVGVGDVCSFAQMDIKKHGNPDWHTEQEEDESGDRSRMMTDQYTQAEDGKVELSLMHFTVTNPNWQPPPDAMEFVENVNLESNRAMFNNDEAIVGPFGVLSSLDFSKHAPPEQDETPASHVHLSTAGGFGRSSLPGANVRQSLFSQRTEGPDMFRSIQNMRASTLILHNRHAMRSAQASNLQTIDKSGAVSGGDHTAVV